MQTAFGSLARLALHGERMAFGIFFCFVFIKKNVLQTLLIKIFAWWLLEYFLFSFYNTKKIDQNLYCIICADVQPCQKQQRYVTYNVWLSQYFYFVFLFSTEKCWSKYVFVSFMVTFSAEKMVFALFVPFQRCKKRGYEKLLLMGCFWKLLLFSFSYQIFFFFVSFVLTSSRAKICNVLGWQYFCFVFFFLKID